MAARAAQTPAVWFPDGRNPWTQLYTPDVLDRIASAVGGCDDNVLDKLGYDLALSAEIAVVQADEVALERSYSERRAWIKREILDPLSVLHRTLHPNNARMTSEWPDSPDLDQIDKIEMVAPDLEVIASRVSQAIRAARDPKKPSRRDKRTSRPSISRRNAILSELEWLESWGEAKLRYLAAKHGRKPKTELKNDFVAALVLTYVRHFPELPKTGIRPDGEETILMRFVKAAAAPVLGDSNLTGQLKKALPLIQTTSGSRRRP